MPLVDMPLSELQTYQGRNPRPDDFDEYWDKALTEMRAIDPKVDLRPADFRAPGIECFDLRFTGVGGARIYAKLAKPAKPAKPCPAIVSLHGYSGSSGDWMWTAGFAALGFVVASLDCRGQGGKSEDVGGVTGTTLRGHIVRGLEHGPEALLFRSVFLDAAQLAGLVIGMPDVDPARVGAMGGSQGGGLTLACAALEPRIKRASPAYPFLCDYRRVWEMDLAKGAYDEMAYFFRNFDPRHEREDEWFRRLGYIDCQWLAPRIKAEVLMAVGLMDTICPPSTQFAAFNKITAPKRTVIYPDFGHEGLPGWSDAQFQFMLGM